MHNVIIADTSCLIVLANIDELDLLQKVYGKITTTPEVASEYGRDLPSWIDIISVADKQKQYILESQVDKGESSAIALALEKTHSLLILDDQKARKIASQLGVQYTGSLGVIVKAKQKGIITSVKPLLKKLRQTNFRLSPSLILEALKVAGESGE